MSKTKTSKTTKQFIKITIVGYIPAADILDMESIKNQHEKLETIKDLAHDNMEVERFTPKSVGRLVEAKPIVEDDTPAQKPNDEEE